MVACVPTARCTMPCASPKARPSWCSTHSPYAHLVATMCPSACCSQAACSHSHTQPDSLVAIQLAKHRGVHVIATCSNSRQKDLLASMLPAIGMCLADSRARPRSLSLALQTESSTRAPRTLSTRCCKPPTTWESITFSRTSTRASRTRSTTWSIASLHSVPGSQAPSCSSILQIPCCSSSSLPPSPSCGRKRGFFRQHNKDDSCVCTTPSTQYSFGRNLS